VNEEQYERYRQLRDQGLSHQEAVDRLYAQYKAARESGLSHEEITGRAEPQVAQEPEERGFWGRQAENLSRIGISAARNAAQATVDYGAGIPARIMRELEPVARMQRPPMEEGAEPYRSPTRSRVAAALEEFPETVRDYLSRFEPEDPGIPELVGALLGRGAVDVGTAIATSGALAGTAPLRVLAGRGALGRIGAGQLANLPIDVAQASVYDEGLFLPGETGALAENLLLTGAAETVSEAIRAASRARQAGVEQSRLGEALRGVDEAERAAREAAEAVESGRRVQEPTARETYRLGRQGQAPSPIEMAISRLERASELAPEARRVELPFRTAEPEGIVGVEGMRPRSEREQAALMAGARESQQRVERLNRIAESERVMAERARELEAQRRVAELGSIEPPVIQTVSPRGELDISDVIRRRAERQRAAEDAARARRAEPAAQPAEELVEEATQSPILRALQEAAPETPPSLIEIPSVSRPRSPERQRELMELAEGGRQEVQRQMDLGLRRAEAPGLREATRLESAARVEELRRLGERNLERMSQSARAVEEAQDASQRLERAAQRGTEESAARARGERGIDLYSFPGPILDFLRTEAGKQTVASGLGAAAGATAFEESPIAGGIAGAWAGRAGLQGLRVGRELTGLAMQRESREAIARAAKQSVSDLISRAPVARGARESAKVKSELGSWYSRIFDRYDTILKLVERTSGEQAAREMNESLAIFDGAAIAGKAEALADYGDWMVENAENLETIGNAAVIRADYANRMAVGGGVLSESGQKLTGYDNARLQEAYDEVMQNPYLVEKTDELQGFFRDILARRVEAGFIGQEVFDRAVKSTDYYTPLYRDFSEMVSSPTQGRGGVRLVPSSGIRKMDRELSRTGRIQDPLEVLVGERMLLASDLAKQDVMQKLIDAVGEDGIEGIIRPLPPGSKRQEGARVFSTPVNGQMRSFEVLDPELFRALEGSRASWGPIMTEIANIKRGTIVLPPDFSAMALLRDLPAYTIERPGREVVKQALPGAIAGGVAGYAAGEEGDRITSTIAGVGIGAGLSANARSAYEIAEGLVHAFKGTDQYQRFLRSGASTAGVAVTDPKNLDKLVKSMSEKDRRTIVTSLKNPIETLEFIGSVAENAPRFAKFQRTGSAWEAQNVTLPFARIGSSETLQKVASATPFFAATLAGWNKLAQVITKSEKFAPSVLAITGPSVGLWFLNKDNEEYWNRPLWERNMFWHIPGWAVGQPETEFKRIPKPFQLGLLYGSLPERILESMARAGIIPSAAPESTSATAEVVSSVADFIKQGVSGTVPIPAAAQPVIESLTNYDFFRDRQITPYFIEQRDPELQYRESTSALGRMAGRIPGLTPIQVDQSIESVLGTTGRRGLDILDIGARALGLPAPESRRTVPEELANIAGLGRFTSEQYDVAQPEYDAYDIVKEVEQAASGVNQLRRENAPPERIRSYIERNRDLLNLYEATKAERALFDDIRAERNRIISIRGATQEQKREALDRLRARGVATAESIFRKYRQIR